MATLLYVAASQSFPKGSLGLPCDGGLRPEVLTDTFSPEKLMKSFHLNFLPAAFVMLSLIIAANAQQVAPVAGNSSATAVRGDAAGVDVERIIRAFTAKETEFRQALNQYSFKRDAVVQSIGMGGQIAGEYHRVSRFVFDDAGQRYEKILLFPLQTIKEFTMTPEDLEDLGGVQTFALETSKIPLYNFTYVGKERIDELDLYVFDVVPKVMPDPKKTKERFFQGRIWVDDQDLQIVKARGKGVPEPKGARFPVFETYREQIDGKYWFPTYTYADEELVFDNGQVVRVRMQIKFTDFERARAKVRVIEDDNVEDVSKPKPTPTPNKPQP